MKCLISIAAALLFLVMVAGHTAWAYDEYVPYTADELDDLLAPIALYPDPLLAQMLPAATFIDQIDEAVRYIWQYGKSAQVDDQPWDVSVRALAHYKDVLFMMDQRYEWTVSLGQAYINQPDDVFDSIQRLRAQALAEGNLVSTSEQQVIVEDGIISIVPVEPEVIYVPQYDPFAVYFEPPVYGFITFSVGLPIGVWLNRDCDWHKHRIRYHGWHGGGWIGRSRPHVHDRDSRYINDRDSAIEINRKVNRLDTSGYRDRIRSDVQKRRERGGKAEAPAEVEKPAGVEKPTIIEAPAKVEAPATVLTPPRVEQHRPPVSEVRPLKRGDNTDVYRGRDIRNLNPASSSGYGGYGSSKDAESYRDRGKTSLDNMQRLMKPARQEQPSQVRQPAQAPAGRQEQPRGGSFNLPAPAQRPSGSGGRQSAPAPIQRQAPAGGGGFNLRR